MNRFKETTFSTPRLDHDSLRGRRRMNEGNFKLAFEFEKKKRFGVHEVVQQRDEISEIPSNIIKQKPIPPHTYISLYSFQWWTLVCPVLFLKEISNHHDCLYFLRHGKFRKYIHTLIII